MSLLRSLSRILTLGSIFAALPTISNAQVQNVTSDVATPIPGVGHDYIKSLSETVNPASGSLSVRIDTGTPKARGLTFPFAFLYNSSGVNQPFMRPSDYKALWYNTSSQFNGVGWTYTIPAMTAIQGQVSLTNPGPPPVTNTCIWISNYVIQAIDSSRHLLPISIGQTDGTNGCGNPGGPSPPSTVLQSADAFFQASTVASSYPFNPTSVTVADLDGTVYSYQSFTRTTLPGPVFAPGTSIAFYGYPSWIKDRNGNVLQVTASNGTTTLTDSLGRPAAVISPVTNNANTVTVSGFSSPYNVQWGSASSNFTTSEVFNGPSFDAQYCPTSRAILANAQSSQVIQTLTLPNGKSYQFQYDSTYGLLNKIIYPSGGTVTYTWGENPYAESFSFPVNNISGQGGIVCSYQYSLPAVVKRVVSFDGITNALEQDFQYSTSYVGCSYWCSKQTIVTTKDLITGQSFETVYNYAPAGAGNPPNGEGGVTAVEKSVVYYKDLGSTVAKSVTKAWFDQFNLACELDTLDNNLISGDFLSYATPPSSNLMLSAVKDKKEYDFGQITSASACQGVGTTVSPPPAGVTPIREATIAYQSFPATPIFPSGPSIFDRPSSVITYGNGTRIAETDYAYDQTSVAAVNNLPAGTHDETNYGSSFNIRGNATTATRKCFIGVTSCTDAVLTMTYDETGQLLSHKDACGNAACTDMTGTNHTTTYSYADNYDSPPSSNTDAYLTQITNPLGQIHKFKYAYSDGQLIQSQNQNDINASRVGTTYIYSDSLRRLTETDFPDGGKTTIAYNDSPYNASTPSPSITTTRAITSSTNLTTLTAFDGLGHTVRSVLTSDPDCASGDRTDTTYDGLGRVHTVSNPYCTTSDPTYGLTTYAYDALGRTTQVTHPDNSTILTAYTGRATQVQDEGNGAQRVTRISQTDALGRLLSVCEVSSSSLIGSAGTPAACGQDIAGTGFLTTYQYDALDNLLQVNQSGIAARAFTYDSLSRLLTAFNPESSTICYGTYSAGVCQGNGYDANGNLLTKTSPAPNQTGSGTVTTAYQYDALNRLTQKSYNDTPTTPTASFIYDCCNGNYANLVGRLYESTVGTGNLTATYSSYDPMGRIAYQFQNIPYVNNTSAGYALPYTYDLMGNMTFGGVGYCNCSIGSNFTYNTAGRLTSLLYYTTTYLSGAHYDAAGRLTADTLGDGETEAWTYNKRAWPVSSTSTLNSTTTYSYNITSFAPNGDILAASDSVNGNWTYSYDPFNRLVGSNKNSGQVVYSYVYDRFGNRWQQNGPNSMQLTFTGNNPSNPQNNNRMDGYSYDAAGNLLNDGSHQYSYDAENHLIQVDGSSGYCSTGTGTAATACYFYDANGHRVRDTAIPDCNGKSGLSGGMGYTYDLSGRWVMQVATGGGGPCNYEFYAGGRHLLHAGGTENYSHVDWLGTERVRTGPAAYVNGHFINWSVCESTASLPFGDGQVTTPYPGNGFPSGCYNDSHLHFTGKERDTESGLDNFGKRYDSSSMGRFMTPDAFYKDSHVGDPQSWNEYAYARNNPLRYVDPTGENATVSQSCSTDANNHTTCNVNVSASISIYAQQGSNLSNQQLQQAASTIQSSIQNAWSGSFTQDGVTYNVSTQVSVSVASSQDAAMSSGAQNVIGISNGNASATADSFVNSKSLWTAIKGGPDTGVWNINNLAGGVAAHEFTHLLGVDDKSGSVLSNTNLLNDPSIPHTATSRDFSWGIKEAIGSTQLGLSMKSWYNGQYGPLPTPFRFSSTDTVGAPVAWWK